MIRRYSRWEFEQEVLFAKTTHMSNVCKDLLEMCEVCVCVRACLFVWDVRFV